MTRLSFFIITFLFMMKPVHSQEIESSAFRYTLKTLLAHSVNEVSVENLENYSVILDTRSIEEFNVSSMKNARWVGYKDFTLERVQDIPKDCSILVYCSVGYRSEKIAEKLLEAGYLNVSNLYGGIFEWINQDHEIVDSTGSRTNKIHAYDRVWGIWLNKGEKVY